MKRSIPEPQFPDDDGGADDIVSQALRAYAAGEAGEHAVLSALASARLLVPVVALLTEEETVGGLRREKESDMALPTLTGEDGRRAVLAFTSMATMHLWRPEARPVAVTAQQACQAVGGEKADALVVDVAGPVQIAIDGVRLAAIAEGRPVPLPHEDPDVLAVIAAVLAEEPGVHDVQVGRGSVAEVAVRFAVAPEADEQAALQRASARLTERLRGRVGGGVEIGVVRT